MNQEQAIARDLARYREFTAAARRGDSYADMNARCYAERLRRLGVSPSMLAGDKAPDPIHAPVAAPLAVSAPVLTPAPPVDAAKATGQNERFDAELSNYFPKRWDYTERRLESAEADNQGDENGRLAAEVTAFLPLHRRKDRRASPVGSAEPTDEAERLASQVASYLPAHHRG